MSELTIPYDNCDRFELLGDQFQGFFDWLEQSCLKPWTQRTYASRIRQLQRYAEINSWSKLLGVSGFTLLLGAFLEDLYAGGALSAASVHSFIAASKAFARYMGQSDTMLAALDSLQSVHARPRERTEKRILTDEQCRRLLEAAAGSRSTRDKVIVLIFLTTKIKIAQCARLELSDLIWQDTGLVIRVTSEYCQHYESIDAELALALRRWLQERVQYLNAMDSKYLFVGRDGGEISVGAIDRSLRKLGWRAGVSTCSGVLRNTYFHQTGSQCRAGSRVDGRAPAAVLHTDVVGFPTDNVRVR